MKIQIAKAVALVESVADAFVIRFSDGTNLTVTHETVHTISGHFIKAIVIRYGTKTIWTSLDYLKEI